jgi:hypothetical protein
MIDYCYSSGEVQTAQIGSAYSFGTSTDNGEIRNSYTLSRISASTTSLQGIFGGKLL